VGWLTREHPDVTTLAQVDRFLMEEYLRWLPGCPSKNTGEPLAVTTLKHEVNAIGAFCRHTAIWGWTDVPGRPLISSRDTPRRPETLPRYLTTQQVDALMGAVEDLTDPLQRAALLLPRRSGARRDEIRRLTIDCLDQYPDGHPRLRIPVGKRHTERIIPLHPDAAAALEEVIARAKTQNPIARRDQTTGELVNYVFVRRGKLVSASTRFDDAFRTVCAAAGLVDPQGQPTVSAHRLRHTMGTQLAEGGPPPNHHGRPRPQVDRDGHDLHPNLRSRDPSPVRGSPDRWSTHRRPSRRSPAPRRDQRRSRSLAANQLPQDRARTRPLPPPTRRGPLRMRPRPHLPQVPHHRQYTPRLRARLDREDQLIADAQQRGWQREVERHQATKRRLEQLLHDLA
jgi:integrase